MKFSENWLRSLTPVSLSTADLSHQLTMAGLEVESVEPAAPAFSGVVIGQVLSVQKHPDADRLNLCQVDVGETQPLQIVCGAKNVAVGVKVPCARVGAVLPKMNIGQAKVRGIESFGMLCSQTELGLAEESDGLWLLPADAPVGENIRVWAELDDNSLTLKLTPNRADCLSLNGLAREVAALTGSSWAVPQYPAMTPAHDDTRAVKLTAADGCPRYCGRVIRGINPQAATPEWMKRRLERSGTRSISAVVDITNYVLLEMGQPLHAFDLSKINGDIEVRWARENEEIELLNGMNAKLQSDMLVIADKDKALALAGVMGGNFSAVSDSTVDIFLESAFFMPDAIMGKGRRLNLTSDSSHRYERGVDFGMTRNAMERATSLILEIAGGAAGPIVEQQAALPQRNPVKLRVARASRVLGIPLDMPQVQSLLQRQQFGFVEQNGELLVTPPSWRFDLEIEVDFIEEIARMHGYDSIPAPEPKAGLRMLPQPEAVLPFVELKQRLAGRDYQEVVTFSFVDESWETGLMANNKPVKLANPIASDMSVMRSGLWGSMLETLQTNLKRQQDRVRVFELGRCFAVEGEGFAQALRLGGLAYGLALPEQWGEAKRPVDFFDVKADITALLGSGVEYVAAQHPALHPGQSARIVRNGQEIGWLGVLHPKWRQQYGLPQAPVLFELDAAMLTQSALPAYREISRLPQVRRDIAVLVNREVDVAQMLAAMQSVAAGFVTDLTVFDIYRGKGIDFDKKSVAFRVLMQDTQKTLSDEETEPAVQNLIRILQEKFAAELRQ